jgi:hypothetical protein
MVRALSEGQLQTTVIGFCAQMRLLCYHTHNSRHSIAKARR